MSARRDLTTPEIALSRAKGGLFGTAQMITSFSSKVKIGLMDVWLASLSASLADGRQRGSFFTGIGPELMPREAAYSLASSSQQSGSGYPTMLIASFLAALDPSSKRRLRVRSTDHSRRCKATFCCCCCCCGCRPDGNLA